MAVLVQIIGAANGARTPHDGRFVETWNSNTRFGILELTSTADRARARRFSDAAEAFEEWRRQSQIEPLRPTDGKPNRPLAGVTITIEHVED